MNLKEKLAPKDKDISPSVTEAIHAGEVSLMSLQLPHIAHLLEDLHRRRPCMLSTRRARLPSGHWGSH